jgi:hypothetical protein
VVLRFIRLVWYQLMLYILIFCLIMKTWQLLGFYYPFNNICLCNKHFIGFALLVVCLPLEWFPFSIIGTISNKKFHLMYYYVIYQFGHWYPIEIISRNFIFQPKCLINIHTFFLMMKRTHFLQLHSWQIKLIFYIFMKYKVK